MSPQRPSVHIDRFSKVGCNNHETVFRDVVRPLDDFRNRSTSSLDLPRLFVELDSNVFGLTSNVILSSNRSWLDRQILYAKSIVLERINIFLHAKRHVVVDFVTKLNELVGEPIAKA